VGRAVAEAVRGRVGQGGHPGYPGDSHAARYRRERALEAILGWYRAREADRLYGKAAVVKATAVGVAA